MDKTHKSAVQESFCLEPEILTAFGILALRIGDKRRDEFEDVFLRMDVVKRIDLSSREKDIYEPSVNFSRTLFRKRKIP